MSLVSAFAYRFIFMTITMDWRRVSLSVFMCELEYILKILGAKYKKKKKN